jgi:hypothetical protein
MQSMATRLSQILRLFRRAALGWLLTAAAGRAELSGGDLLLEVRDRLPPETVTLRGFIRTREGRRDTDRGLVSTLDFGASPPRVAYRLMDGFGTPVLDARITWTPAGPNLELRDPGGEPVEGAVLSDEIPGTGLSWSDLSLDFLWWTGAEITGQERIKTRAARVVRVPAPPGRPDLSAVTLWIDTATSLPVRAELLDPGGVRLKRIDVDSLLELEPGVWMVKDLLIRDYAGGRRMGVRFEEVLRGDPQELSNIPIPVMEPLP